MMISQQAVTIRPLRESDLPLADHIFRQAFGTFLGVPDLFGDSDYIRSRWLADPGAAFAAERDGELVGSNFVTNWGTVGFFGPLTVRPDLWDRGIAQRLLEPTMDLFLTWKIKHRGLFTFAHSPKHVALYQKVGFWPRFLTAIMAKPLSQTTAAAEYSRFSEVAETQREAALTDCRELTSAVYEGFDLTREIRAVATQRLGDTLLRWDGSGLEGVTVCHSGAGSEAGSGACYVKVGAVRPGPNAGQSFEQLLDACEHYGAMRGATRTIAGANMGRHEAYRTLLSRGYRTQMQGVAMHSPNEPGYNRPGVYLIDDWR
jgi:predicted N-acetyltransferase YhbS